MRERERDPIALDLRSAATDPRGTSPMSLRSSAIFRMLLLPSVLQTSHCSTCGALGAGSAGRGCSSASPPRRKSWKTDSVIVIENVDLSAGADPNTLRRLNFFHSVLRVMQVRCFRSSDDTGCWTPTWFRIQCLVFSVQGLGFWVLGFGFRV